MVDWLPVDHAWLPYIRVFQMSAIPRVFGQQLLNLTGCVTNFDMLFLVMGFISFVDEIQYMQISSCYICIRSKGNS